MESASIPSNEGDRLQALRCYNILDTPPEAAYDDVAQIAAALCDTPIALISLVDNERQWFKARVGVVADSTPRSVAFCAHAILSDEVLVVQDATTDPRFAVNPLVTGPPGVRSYAGAPIITDEGMRLGTVCVIDRVPRYFTPEQIKNLASLSRQVACQMELRLHIIRQNQINSDLETIRERLDLVVQASYDGVWEIDLLTGRIECSDQAKQLLKLTAQSSVGLETIRRIVHVADYHAALRAVARLIKHRRTIDLQLRVHTASGESRWFHARATCNHSATGGPTRIVGSLSDIHERKTAQQRLDRLTWLLEESQKQAHVGGWEYDIPGNSLSWTPETYRIHDLDPTKPPPSISEAIHYYSESSRPTIELAVRNAIEHGISYCLELELINAKGRRLWVATTGKAVQEGGRTVRLIGAFQDITGRVVAAQELRRVHDAAEAANRAKSSFLAVMSHEIRTPMHAILGYTEMLQESLITAQQKEYSAIISGAGQSLLRLLDDILELSKVESGTVQLEISDISTASILEDIAQLLKWQLTAKKLDISIEKNTQNVDFFVKADQARLRQVFLNLIGNAIKFTSKGSIRIQIQPHGDMDVRVSITDTGIGIPESQIHRLFQDFSQVDGSSRRQYGGTGLGLAICRRLVNAMGGSIGVHSTEHVGSTFWVTLPKSNGLAGSSNQIIPNLQETPSKHNMVGKRVLVAEDNMLNARLVSTLFLNQGLQVDLAQDGEEAIAMASKSDYDIIFMDCLMPHTDGFDATKSIRRNRKGNGARVPIIALTANAMPEDRQACLDAGMNDLVSKPFTKAILMKSLHQWLSTKHER